MYVQICFCDYVCLLAWFSKNEAKQTKTPKQVIRDQIIYVLLIPSSPDPFIWIKPKV